MSTNQSDVNSLGLNRWGTAAFIGILFGVAFFLMTSGKSLNEQKAQRQSAESAYIEANGCVVAQMNGRWVSKYRCEKPEPRYLSAAELVREAQVGAAKS